jgi:dTDP-glucose 4,6-dehydratase
VEAERHNGRLSGEGAAPGAPVSGRSSGISTLLVTGGAGFIGSNLVQHLLDHTEAHLVVIDKLTYAGSLLNLEQPLRNPRVRFVHADIADRAAIAHIFSEARPAGLFNLAAETHVDRSIDGPQPFIDTNIVGTFVLLETARQYLASAPAGTREPFRFLHVSTDEVYGTLGPSGLFSEETPYAPNSPYAASKASADHLVRAYARTYGMPLMITNCSNNYGPFQFPEKLIPLTILNAVEGRPLPIYGDGGNVRDWLHVEDHCAGLLLVFRRGRIGEKYNIGAGNERTSVNIVDAVCELLEELRPARTNPALKDIPGYGTLKTFVADRPGHDRRYAIDATKIRRELGWAARYGFEDGLRATIRWYLEHPDWCEQIQAGRYNRERLGLQQ